MKSENILLDGNGHIKLADFGLSICLNGKECVKSFCGSLAYICPEMLGNKGVSKACDIWGLGTLLFECLNGRPPFIADTI